MRNVALVWIVATIVWSSMGSASAQDTTLSPDEEFKLARNAFAYGNYGDAVRRFRSLLYPLPGRLSESQRTEAHKYLAISYYYLYLRTQKKRFKRAAEREFTRFLVQDPKAVLDPLLYPPNLIAFFNRVKTENKRRLDAILRRRRQQRNATQVQIVRLRMERKVTRFHPLLVALPFGAPQFINREPLKGSLFLTGEVLALGLNIGAYAAIFSMQIKEGDQRGRFRQEDLDAVTRWQVVQFASIGAFAALVIAGIVDAAIHLPKRRVTVLPQLPPLDTRRFSAPPALRQSSFLLTAP